MTKAINKGTCQCCGAVQKLPNGRLSKHGYNVSWGFFRGVCNGAGKLPFEQSTDLIETFIKQAEDQILNINEKIKEISESVDPNSVWYSLYVRYEYGIKAHYVWQKRGIILDNVSDNYSRWIWEEFDTDKRSVNRGYGHVGNGHKDVEKAVKFENQKYIDELESNVKDIQSYIKWQDERIVDWKPQELLPL